MTDLASRFHTAINALPLIAILRGIETEQAVTVASTLIEEGFSILEVPLNSPNALDSIREIAAAHPTALVGADNTARAVHDNR